MSEARNEVVNVKIVAAAIISASEVVVFMEFSFFCIDCVFNTGDTISDEGFSRYGV